MSSKKSTNFIHICSGNLMTAKRSDPNSLAPYVFSLCAMRYALCALRQSIRNPPFTLCLMPFRYALCALRYAAIILNPHCFAERRLVGNEKPEFMDGKIDSVPAFQSNRLIVPELVIV